MKALIVGGTQPTGHFLIKDLLTRGYRVSIFHRGTHESDEIPKEVEHLHGDPHFLETIENALKGKDCNGGIWTPYRESNLISGEEIRG